MGEVNNPQESSRHRCPRRRTCLSSEEDLWVRLWPLNYACAAFAV